MVDPNKRALEMATPPIAKIDMEAFAPLVEYGTTAESRAPEVIFQTSINVLVMLGKQHEEDVAGASQGRRYHLIQELWTMATSANECMTTLFNPLLPKNQVARRRVICEANHGIDEF